MVAMHMANELLTPWVAAVFFVLSGGVLALASRAARAGLDQDRVPLMGVIGAFVFAAQMINFPILPGVSGHLGGGVLLAILLGPHAATLVMASILIVQCLIFQDGGLLALGTNILNLGIIPCYLGYGIFHVLAGTAPASKRLYVAVFTAALAGMVAGATLVAVQVWLSDRLPMPFAHFTAAILGLHVLVGTGEGIITFLVIGYLCKVRPQMLGQMAQKLKPAAGGMRPTAVLASLALAALVLAGIASAWASSSPDALESVTTVERDDKVSSSADLTARVSALQEATAPLPDYQVPGWSESLGTRISGVLGTVLVLILAWAIGRALQHRAPDPAGEQPT